MHSHPAQRRAGSGSRCGVGGTCQLSMDGYGKTFGPDGKGGCILDTDPSDGIGRFPYRHGANKDEGSYGSPFINSMWAKYAKPSGATH